MREKIEMFRQELNRVFDDDLHTKQWHNYVDYAIIGLIIISTIEVFLSTYDGVVGKYGKWLNFVDYFTTASLLWKSLCASGAQTFWILSTKASGDASGTASPSMD